jgi:hypothetical protein
MKWIKKMLDAQKSIDHDTTPKFFAFRPIWAFGSPKREIVRFGDIICWIRMLSILVSKGSSTYLMKDL